MPYLDEEEKKKKKVGGSYHKLKIAGGPGVSSSEHKAIMASREDDVTPAGIGGRVPASTDKVMAKVQEPTVIATQPPTPAGRGGRGITVNLSEKDKAIKQSIADIDKSIAAGARPTTEQSARIRAIKREAGFLRGGTDRVPVGPAGRPIGRGVGRGVGRGATFEERGISPMVTGGVRRRPVKRDDLERKIEPPKSIGDMIRYKREVQKLEQDRAFEEKSRRTDIAGEGAALGVRRQEAEEKQAAFTRRAVGEERAETEASRKKVSALSTEYSSPATSDERKLEIEREISVLGGKQPTRPQAKSTALTEKQKIDTAMKIEKEFKKSGKKPWIGEDETKYDWLRRTYPDLAEQFGGKGAQRNSRAEAHLKANPDLADKFEEKYGYLPEGF